MPMVTPPVRLSPDALVSAAEEGRPLYANMQQAIVLPMAREKRQTLRTTSLAVAASAPDHVKTQSITNQDASSGKCVCTSCASRAPTAYRFSSALFL
ncbi:hypothetical protein IG631_08848 [Alternaria alternata]|nr:hypothetical protein IG631_08848 [Alternaria alternata]